MRLSSWYHFSYLCDHCCYYCCCYYCCNFLSDGAGVSSVYFDFWYSIERLLALIWMILLFDLLFSFFTWAVVALVGLIASARFWKFPTKSPLLGYMFSRSLMWNCCEAHSRSLLLVLILPCDNWMLNCLGLSGEAHRLSPRDGDMKNLPLDLDLFRGIGINCPGTTFLNMSFDPFEGDLVCSFWLLPSAALLLSSILRPPNESIWASLCVVLQLPWFIFPNLLFENSSAAEFFRHFIILLCGLRGIIDSVIGCKLELFVLFSETRCVIGWLPSKFD